MNPFAPPDEADDLGPMCPLAAADVQRLLDGVPLSSETASHRAACGVCRMWLASARELQRGLELMAASSPPPAFAERVTVAVVRDARWRRFQRRATSLLALAVALLFALWLARPKPLTPRPNPPLTPADVAEVPSLRDSLTEARSAVVALTHRATTVVPTWTAPDVRPPTRSVPETMVAALEPAAQSLDGVRSGAVAGFEPVAHSFRRAVGLFAREVPAFDLSFPESKPGSVP